MKKRLIVFMIAIVALGGVMLSVDAEVPRSSSPGSKTATTNWHYIDTAPAGFGDTPYHSASHSWYCGDPVTGEYDSFWDEYLTPTTAVDLSTYNSAQVRFWQWLDSESGYDYARVEASTDGAGWTQVWEQSGGSSAWEEITVDISAYISATTWVRFWFHSDSSNVATGWLVDDVVIEATAETQTCALPLEDFEGAWGPMGDNPPTGWTIIDNGDGADGWNNNDWHNYDNSGDQVARAYWSPVENQDEDLITPVMDLSAMPTVTLEYWYNYQDYSTDSTDWGYVDLSLDGGSTWPINLMTYVDADVTGIEIIDISTQAGGEATVAIRFRYVGNDDMYWYVDDVSVCAPFSPTWTEIASYDYETGDLWPVELMSFAVE
ncbi:MAG: hypothetical protein GY856_50750 [bacterium]|nr:hypothetical protein [bacterium]